jgi:hypothetical protein
MGIHRLGSVTWPGGVVTAELFSDGSWSATVRGEDCGYLAQALEQATPTIHKNRSQNQSSMGSVVGSIGPLPDFLTSRTGRRTDGTDPTTGHAP